MNEIRTWSMVSLTWKSSSNPRTIGTRNFRHEISSRDRSLMRSIAFSEIVTTLVQTSASPNVSFPIRHSHRSRMDLEGSAPI